MKLYKMMKAPYAKSLVETGDFMFRRLRYYRMLEAVFGDPSIGDIEEGVTSATVSAEIGPHNRDTKVSKNILASARINASTAGNATVTMSNVKINNTNDNYFVYCFSMVANPDLSYTGSSYDAKITLARATALKHYLNTFGTEKSTGTAVTSMFDPIQARPVVYDDFQYDAALGPLPAGDPFRKRKRYKNQSEYRFALNPRQTILKDSVVISCPRARELLSFDSLPVALHPEQERKDKQYYKDLLDSILNSWKYYSDQCSHLEFPNPKIEGQVSRYMELKSKIIAEFDEHHRTDLLRCLFELRKEPYDDRLDSALARAAESDHLIRMYNFSLLNAVSAGMTN